jgi:hypothetical protein
MSDPLDIYSDDAIARLYDHFDVWGPGDEFYLGLARERSRIRLIDQPHLARLIGQAGLLPAAFYGWWDRTPFGPGSREIIAVMGKAAQSKIGSADP